MTWRRRSIARPERLDMHTEETAIVLRCFRTGRVAAAHLFNRVRDFNFERVLVHRPRVPGHVLQPEGERLGGTSRAIGFVGCPLLGEGPAHETRGLRYRDTHQDDKVLLRVGPSMGRREGRFDLPRANLYQG